MTMEMSGVESVRVIAADILMQGLSHSTLGCQMLCRLPLSLPPSTFGRSESRRYYRRLPQSGCESRTRHMSNIGRLLASGATVVLLFTSPQGSYGAQDAAEKRLASRIDPYVGKQRMSPADWQVYTSD